MKAAFKIGISAVLFSIVLIGLSALINEAWLGEAHDAHDFFRPMDDPLVTPGLAITTMLWGVLLSIAFRRTSDWIPIRSAFLKGAAFGLSVFVLYILCHELFYYQFIQFDVMLLVGGLIHYLLTLLLGGGILGLIHRS